jgi:hypothetical protein
MGPSRFLKDFLPPTKVEGSCNENTPSGRLAQSRATACFAFAQHATRPLTRSLTQIKSIERFFHLALRTNLGHARVFFR